MLCYAVLQCRKPGVGVGVGVGVGAGVGAGVGVGVRSVFKISSLFFAA